MKFRIEDPSPFLMLGCYGVVLIPFIAWWVFVIFIIIKTAQHFGIL